VVLLDANWIPEGVITVRDKSASRRKMMKQHSSSALVIRWDVDGGLFEPVAGYLSSTVS